MSPAARGGCGSWRISPRGCAIRSRGGLAVVTGSPGCGKSAMLALPVLLTDAQRRDALVAGANPGSLLARAADLFGGLPVLGVHARGMNPYQAADAIAQHLGRSADSPEELLDDLDDRPETSSADRRDRRGRRGPRPPQAADRPFAAAGPPARAAGCRRGPPPRAPPGRGHRA